jgi:hypothetical protein
MATGGGALVAIRGTTPVNMAFVVVAVATAGLVAAGVYRSLAPLVSEDSIEQTEMLGGRTRAALEREKTLVLRSIKEVEFDRAMRKISGADYQEMVTRLRGRAARLIRELDGGMGYRELVERDLAARLNEATGSVATAPQAGRLTACAGAPPTGEPATTRLCPRCQTQNDRDARFCKACGSRLQEGA